MRQAVVLPLLLLLAGCDSAATHVAGPFYLWYFNGREEMALYRCAGGRPEDGHPCAAEKFLPGATAFAAGANSKYIVVARHPRSNNVTNGDITQYFYFARTPQESWGWGKNPEKVIGPLTQAEFDAASMAHHLPPLSIVLDDLK